MRTETSGICDINSDTSDLADGGVGAFLPGVGDSVEPGVGGFFESQAEGSGCGDADRPARLDGNHRRLPVNRVAEAFFSMLQCELLDQHDWTNKDQLAAAIFEWIETRSRYAGDPPRGLGVLEPRMRWGSVHSTTGSTRGMITPHQPRPLRPHPGRWPTAGPGTPGGAGALGVAQAGLGPALDTWMRGELADWAERM